MSVRPGLEIEVVPVRICDASKVSDVKGDDWRNAEVLRNRTLGEDHPVCGRLRRHHFSALNRVWARFCPPSQSTPPL